MGNKRKFQKEKNDIIHRKGLIELYNKQILYETKFMKLVLENAIHKLENKKNPKKVEDWVVDLEKKWRKLI